MYGVGHLTLGIILTEARCRVTFIHERHNPLFGGRSPAPDLEALRMLRDASCARSTTTWGWPPTATPTASRSIDERGNYIHINDLLLLLYWYLHEVKGQRGGVVRNLATTHLLDRLAAAFGEKCIETPVGFKWIAAGMVAHNALLGGESSGGLTIRGHILGKDGIFASALIVEMLAMTGKHISELQEIVWGITGRLYSVEDNLPATADMRIIVPQRVKALIAERVGALSGRQGRRLRRHQALLRARQLGAAALLRHRAGAAHLRRGRYAREGARAGGLAEAVRTGDYSKRTLINAGGAAGSLLACTARVFRGSGRFAYRFLCEYNTTVWTGRRHAACR